MKNREEISVEGNLEKITHLLGKKKVPNNFIVMGEDL